MKKSRFRGVVLTTVAAVTVLSTGATLGENFTAGEQNVAAATAKPRYKKVIDHTKTYGAKEWPGSVLAPGTKTIDVPYQSHYKMNWNNVVKYFYEYLNQLAALNHATPAQPDPETMKFAQKRAEAQKNENLSHDGSGNYDENLSWDTYTYPSDQEYAYNIVMGWFDEGYAMTKAHQKGHYGHRANLLFGRGKTGLGYSRGYVAYDATDVTDWTRLDALNDETGFDKSTVGLPKTIFRYYHMEQLGKPKYDLSFKGTAVMKHSAKMLRRNSDNTFSNVKTLGKGQAFKVSRTVLVDGQTYFGLGGSQYVRATDVTLRKYGTAHVNYNRNYGIQIWTGDHKAIKTSYGSKTLMGQTNWNVFGKVTIGGKTYYNLGGNQFIDARYVTVR